MTKHSMHIVGVSKSFLFKILRLETMFTNVPERTRKGLIIVYWTNIENVSKASLGKFFREGCAYGLSRAFWYRAELSWTEPELNWTKQNSSEKFLFLHRADRIFAFVLRWVIKHTRLKGVLPFKPNSAVFRSRPFFLSNQQTCKQAVRIGVAMKAFSLRLDKASWGVQDTLLFVRLSLEKGIYLESSHCFVLRSNWKRRSF